MSENIAEKSSYGGTETLRQGDGCAVWFWWVLATTVALAVAWLVVLGAWAIEKLGGSTVRCFGYVVGGLPFYWSGVVLGSAQ